MEAVFSSIIGFMADILGVLDTCILVVYGFPVSLLHLLGAFLVVSICITLFWKGGQG